MSTAFSCECTLVYPCFPNAYAIQCMPRSIILFLIHKVASKTKWDKFRIEELIRSLIGTNFLNEFEIHYRTSV
jgi:hypothetical protein